MEYIKITNLNQKTNEHKKLDLTNPPGGILIWLIVIMEVCVFAAGFVVVALLRKNSPNLFAAEQIHFQLKSGLIMTILLMASGWMLAEAVHEYFCGQHGKAKLFHHTGVLTGVIFLIYKYIDFKDKAQQGLTLGKNEFWDVYWLLAGFHFIHVFIGLLLIGVVSIKLRMNVKFEDEDFALRGSALFWHMCDLAWFFLFPLFYVQVI